MKLIIKQRGNLYSLMLYIDNGGPYHIIFYSEKERERIKNIGLLSTIDTLRVSMRRFEE